MTDSDDWESAAGGSFTVQKDTELDNGGGQAWHEDHFLLEGGPVRVLCERRLKDLVFTLSEFMGFLFELHVEKSKAKEVTDLDDNRGGR